MELQQQKTVQLNDEQLQGFLDHLTQRIEWSTNRIVDETKPKRVLGNSDEPSDVFSTILRVALSMLFCGYGSVMFILLLTNWGTYWIGGIQNVAVIFTLFIFVACIAIGIGIWKEKDRNYLVALFSALVALVALIVSLVK